MSTEHDTASDETVQPPTTEPEADPDAEPVSGADSDSETVSDPGRADRRRPLLLVAVVLLVLGLASAGWFGYRWAAAATDSDVSYASARDDVLRAGEQMAINVTSPDYQHLDAFKQRLEDSTTGQLHDQVGKSIDQYRAQLDQNKLVTQSELVDGAVTALDLHANTASVLVVVKATKKPTVAGAKPVPPQQLPIVINLTRTGDGAPWKADSISGAPTAGEGQ